MSRCEKFLYCSHAITDGGPTCHPIPDRASEGRYLPPRGRGLGCGRCGVALSKNRQIRVPRHPAGQDPSCVIEIARDGESGLGDYKGPWSGGDPI